VKSVLVIGLGSFGAGVAEALHKNGHRVVAIDEDAAIVERFADDLPEVLIGDGTDVEALEKAGARDADAAIVATGHDVTASLLSTLALRDLGVREIYAKVGSDLHARILDTLGLATGIFPEREAANLLAKRVTRRTILNYVELGPGFSAQEMAVPDCWVGRTLRQLELPRKHNVAVVAVRDVLADRYTPVPDPDAPLKGSDTLLVAGRDGDLEKVARVS
jgi:trk system potassium uptake protein TrkA